MGRQGRWAALAIGALLVALWSATPARAETVHLATGESIQGKIVRVDGDSISIESGKGFGVIQIRRADITLIEFDAAERDLSRQTGIGYYHRAAPSSVSGQAAEYGVDALSFKTWISSTDSVDVLLGFYNAEAIYEVFSLDVRFARVLKRQANLDVYGGGSLGYLNVYDATAGTTVDDQGWSVRAFIGLELFFLTLPNIGFSSELSIGTQDVGGTSRTNISATTFPTLSVRYYF